MSSATKAKIVILYGMGCDHEALAAATTLPGMLVERADGEVQPHSTAGGPASTHFADHFGMTGGTIDTAYASSEVTMFKTMLPGGGVNALLAAGATAVPVDTLLASAGDGTLRVAAVDEIAVAQALEAVDNSGGAERARIRVEVIPAQRTAAT